MAPGCACSAAATVTHSNRGTFVETQLQIEVSRLDCNNLKFSLPEPLKSGLGKREKHLKGQGRGEGELGVSMPVEAPGPGRGNGELGVFLY